MIPAAVAQAGIDGRTYGVRGAVGDGDAAVLRPGGPLALVRAPVRRGLPHLFGVRIPPGCVAVRGRRADLVRRSTEALVGPALTTDLVSTRPIRQAGQSCLRHWRRDARCRG